MTNHDMSKIKFVDLTEVIEKPCPCFAFYNTETGFFMDIGKVYTSIDHFEKEMKRAVQMRPEDIKAFMDLIPEDWPIEKKCTNCMNFIECSNPDIVCPEYEMMTCENCEDYIECDDSGLVCDNWEPKRD